MKVGRYEPHHQSHAFTIEGRYTLRNSVAIGRTSFPGSSHTRIRSTTRSSKILHYIVTG